MKKKNWKEKWDLRPLKNSLPILANARRSIQPKSLMQSMWKTNHSEIGDIVLSIYRLNGPCAQIYFILSRNFSLFSWHLIISVSPPSTACIVTPHVNCIPALTQPSGKKKAGGGGDSIDNKHQARTAANDPEGSESPGNPEDSDGLWEIKSLEDSAQQSE